MHALAPEAEAGPSLLNTLRQAANSVLDTLTDADYAGLVAFDGCTLTYASEMKRVTDDERARMKHWVSHLMPGSTTNYAAAFESAFAVLGSAACRKGRVFGGEDLTKAARCHPLHSPE